LHGLLATVKAYLHRTFAKLGVSSRTQLLALANAALSVEETVPHLPAEPRAAADSAVAC
jgi:hypothetical protein